MGSGRCEGASQQYVDSIFFSLTTGMLISIGVCVEWLKSRMCTQRWEEELRLLPEELRRSVAFLAWKAAQWEQRATMCQDVDSVLQIGLHAYAAKQAAISHGLSVKFLNT